MENVLILPVDEPVQLEPGALEQLYGELGDAAAEDVVHRAMEGIAMKLAHVERLYRQGAQGEMPKPVRALAAIAEQVGMLMLARIAGDVQSCLRVGDQIALAAVLQRLMRAGESSLSEIWQLQDMSL